MTRPFEITKDVELDATPDEVWAALATPEGLASWLFGPFEIVPGDGGSFRLTIGDFTETSTITGWDPPRRLTLRGQTGEDGAFQAFTYDVEAIDGGKTRLRFVQSGMLSDSWGDEYSEMTSYGWDAYFHTLNQYLTHFKGRHAHYIMVAGPSGASPETVWNAITTGLGLPTDLAPGDHVHLTPTGFPPSDGVLDLVVPGHILGIRTSDALHRYFIPQVTVAHHDFTPNLDVEGATESWRNWLNGLPL